MEYTDRIELQSTLSASVRALALERDISERTAWRWTARLRTDGQIPRHHGRCEHCARPLPQNATSRRRFCNDLCRVQSHRHQPPTQTRHEATETLTEMVSLDEAAYLLNVSRRLLAETLDSLPITARREGNNYRLPRAELADLFTGSRALPLAQQALAQAARRDHDPYELARLANNNTAALRRAHRQAHNLTRLTRAAKAPHHQYWKNAERLLQAAINTTLLEQGRWPTRTDYQQLARNLEQQARSLKQLADTMQKRGEWNDEWNQQHTLAAAAPIIVRTYLTDHRSRPSGHTVDHVKLWQQTAGDDCQTQARDGLQGVADLLDYRENLLDPATTAARQIADWLKHVTEPAATDVQPDTG